MDGNLKIVGILTIGLAAASLLGYICRRFRLPSILGYLLAGYIIGPYSPGFVADLHIAEQLAEIGVILMLFGVGMHFKIEDLLDVKQLAIPGALCQTVASGLMGMYFTHKVIGWSLEAGIIIGLAIGVASTVVLVRVLTDNNLVETPEGHIAVGWTIVEDIITVAALILLPMIAAFFHNNQFTVFSVIEALVMMTVKFVLLAFIMLTWGKKIVSYLLTAVVRLRSHELFTLTVLAVIFIIATGSSVIFGTSIALGAFIAGIVIGQTETSHQASANSLPLKEVFAVIFFLSVGMLFNPQAIQQHFLLFIGILGIIVIIKPLAACLTLLGLHFPIKGAVTVGLAISQIGEFSFIFAEQALHYKLIPDTAYDILVACALISIAINPFLFQFLQIFETQTFKNKATLSLKARLAKYAPEKFQKIFKSNIPEAPKVIVVGFGPVGQAVIKALEENHIMPAILEQNIDTVPKIKDMNRHVMYGDATSASILESIHITKAKLLVITVPETSTAISIIKSAREVNPSIHILTRVKYISEEHLMKELKVDFICCERETLNSFTNTVESLAQTM